MDVWSIDTRLQAECFQGRGEKDDLEMAVGNKENHHMTSRPSGTLAISRERCRKSSDFRKESSSTQNKEVKEPLREEFEDTEDFTACPEVRGWGNGIKKG